MKLHYQIIGEGSQTVMVLPDWFGGGAYMAGLGHRVDGRRYRYVVVEHRGYGNARGDAGSHTLTEMADDLLAVADEVGAQTFHLLGHSMGGKAAQLLAAKHPERLKSVVAMTPTPPIALDLDSGTRALLEGCVTDIGNRRIALNAATGGQYGEGFIDVLATLSWEASDPLAFRHYLEAWCDTDIRSELGVSNFPIHVIVGDQDPFVPEAAMREFVAAAFPEMKLTVLEGVGHYPLLEVPPRAAAIMENVFGLHS